MVGYGGWTLGGLSSLPHPCWKDRGGTDQVWESPTHHISILAWEGVEGMHLVWEVPKGPFLEISAYFPNLKLQMGLGY